MEIRKGVYEHYKGNRYMVIGMATHSETREPMVVYVPLSLTRRRQKVDLTVRPAFGKEGFLEVVRKPEYHWKGPRFKFLFAVDDVSHTRTK